MKKSAHTVHTVHIAPNFEVGMLKRTVRVPMMMEPTMVEKIDNWSFAKRIRTRAEAIRQLVQVGMEASKEETKKADAMA